MARKKKKLGDILVEWGVVSEAAVNEAIEHAKQEHMRLGEALISLGLADEEDVTKAMATQYDMEYIDLEQGVSGARDMKLIPDELIRKHLVLPLGREDGKLKVVITDPLDLETLDMLHFRLNCDIETCLASKTKVRNYIDEFMRGDLSIDEAVQELERHVSIDEEARAAVEDQLQDADEQSAPIVRLVTMLITEAVRIRASDIHVEPMTNRVRVRYRVDGVCADREPIPKHMQGAVINRFKLMAGVDLAERRIPQDGRIKMRVAGSDVDFRVSVLPAYHGESIVLRILRPESAKVGITATWALKRTTTRIASSGSSVGRTASSWSPARPALARPPPCIPP